MKEGGESRVNEFSVANFLYSLVTCIYLVFFYLIHINNRE